MIPGRFTSIACHQVSFKCGSVRPKFGFGIGNQNQGPIWVSVSEPKLFFSKFTHFFLLLGGI